MFTTQQLAKQNNMQDYGDYINGFIERQTGGSYGGNLTIEGIDLSPIQAQYFVNQDNNYLWIKRAPKMVYDTETQRYTKRERKPPVEIYMKKQVDNGGVVSYKGTFTFMRFRFSIVGVWDRILGKDRSRLNLYVERLPMSEQVILNGINERKQKNEQR